MLSRPYYRLVLVVCIRSDIFLIKFDSGSLYNVNFFGSNVVTLLRLQRLESTELFERGIFGNKYATKITLNRIHKFLLPTATKQMVHNILNDVFPRARAPSTIL